MSICAPYWKRKVSISRGVIMKYQEIVEWKRRMEFNMTEPETLIQLIEDAKKEGDKVRKDMERLRSRSPRITNFLHENSLILGETALKDATLKYTCSVGIDGSFQLVGGAGGTWYAPISVARVVFDNGLGTQPRVDIFRAGIEKIEMQDESEAKNVAEVKMLSLETKAIFNWGTQTKGAYVFIDGPIVDPPVISPEEEEYIESRCEAIKNCIKTSVAVGCVKRLRDKFYIKHLETIMSEEDKKCLEDFPNDQHLLAYVFALLRSEGYYGPIFTKWVDISSTNDIYKLYKEHGVYIVSLFFQKEVKSKILRLDIPFKEPPAENPVEIDKEIIHIVKAVNEWTYPEIGLPLPIFLAHNKCNIREGCADILYEEIMTRSHASDFQNQIILTWIR